MKSDLVVITRTKKLVSYIITITEKSPIKFRYSFVNKLHNLGMEIIEALYYANALDLNNPLRSDYQIKAKIKLSLLDYISEASYEAKCITMSQYANIGKEIYSILSLLEGWINSDLKRKEELV